MADAEQPLAAESDEFPASGRQIGGYRLLRRLGRGAMAEVYLAEQTSLKRHVALKVLRRSLASDDSYVKRFHLEAQAAAALVHANIVQIYEVGLSEGLHFIAQEYVPGLNLHELIVKRGLPELPRALQIMRQAALALAKAADAGIVHRDIKPENIMLDDSGDVKVADFGLARLAGDSGPPHLTQAGITMGTPLYMSPEQVEGKRLDARSDLYSLGCTFFQLLSGETPFRGDSALAVAVQHLNVEPPRLDSLRPDLPPELCQIVSSLLAKQPSMRPQSARELIAQLQRVEASMSGLGSHSRPAPWSSGRSGTEQPASPAAAQLDAALQASRAAHAVERRRNWVAAALACASLGVGLTAAYALRERPLLDAPRDAPIDRPIDRLKTAEQQLRYATQMLHPSDVERREAALKAVEEYFPTHRAQVVQSKRQLALLYLQEDDYPRAESLFRDLTQSARNNAEQRAFALAGEAIVAAARQDKAAFARSMQLLLPLRPRLDADMSKLLDLVIKRHQSQLQQDLLKKWSDAAGER